MGYVRKSGGSKEALERATITQAMDSNTSRMSNPLNQFAYSDRMKPTHNPIKVKSIAFDDSKQIREVDRGNSRLEVDYTILSAQ